MVADHNVGKKFLRCPCNRIVAPRPGSTELNNACCNCCGSVNKKKCLGDERGNPLAKAGQQIADEPVDTTKAKNKARAARRKKAKTEASDEEWADTETLLDTDDDDRGQALRETARDTGGAAAVIASRLAGTA